MAFSEFELKRYEKIVDAYVQKNRPPPHIRSQLDLSHRIHGQSVEIFEIRPMWNDPNESIENPVIKATYTKRTNTWKVYWQRADLKWHRYEPEPDAADLDGVLDILKRDEYACFYG